MMAQNLLRQHERPLPGMTIFIVILLGLKLTTAACRPAIVRATALTPVETADILAATVVIQMVAPYVDEDGNRQFAVIDDLPTPLNTMDTGLGTLVGTGDVTIVVTHDHWNLVAAPELEVRILDATGTILQILSGDAFRSLIRYRDGRVMILNAPGSLASVRRAGNGDAVQPGSLVTVVYRDPLSGQLTVVPAAVEAQLDYKDVPSFRLDNLQDQRIEPGNSGGGVWYEGQLIGVISHTILAEVLGSNGEVESKHASDRSYAARLSAVRMPDLAYGQPIASR